MLMILLVGKVGDKMILRGIPPESNSSMASDKMRDEGRNDLNLLLWEENCSGILIEVCLSCKCATTVPIY